jgi:hypothetical protein
MTATTIIPEVTKEIKFNRETKDYDCFITIDELRQYIGSAPTHPAAETKCRDYAFSYYEDNHTPEKAAQVALTDDPECTCDAQTNATMWRRGDACVCFDQDFQHVVFIAIEGRMIEFEDAAEVAQLRHLVRLLLRPDVLRAIGLGTLAA